ncbi:MAG: MG2 domain-containing protein, partial [Chitinophagaceae bacterium]
IRLQLLHQNDHLFLEEDLYTTGQSPQVAPVGQRLQSFLFTDRSIYRPGQLLFFKGMLIAQEGPDQQKAAANTPSRVYLRNANGTMVDSLSVTSNLYGSFSGQFRIPTGNLTGNYTLQEKTGNGLISFSVEEYRRPKFQVSLSPKKNSYQLNDSVTIQGSAITFSGIPLSAAQVKYRVVRKTYWPFFNSTYTRNRFIPFPSSGEQEITHGYTTILGEGAFSITFKALPDLIIEKNQNPVFYFEVQADVTDASGETRSSLHTLPLAWNSMILQFRSPAVLRSDTTTPIYVEAKNLSGERVAVPIQLTVEALEPCSSSLRERYWSEPDQFLYSAEEYHRYFPLDIYKNEQDPFSWK